MAADLTAAIKRCKLSPEAGAAELRRALEETTDFASATDAGYSLVGYREIVPRYENGEPVPGQLFTFRRGGP